MQDVIAANVTVTDVNAVASAQRRVRIGPRNPSNKQAEVLVQKDSDQIHSIVITCPCGETVTIVCDYE